MGTGSIRTDIPDRYAEMMSLFFRNLPFMGLKFRYVTASDPDYNARCAWLDTVIQNYKSYNLSSAPEILTSTAFMDFDVFIFGGKNVAHAAAFIKRESVILKNKIKIYICRETDSRHRAKLIDAGFDDVMEANRTHPLEFISRLYAIWRRYGQVRMLAEETNAREHLLLSVSDFHKLTIRQRHVLLYLLDAPDMTSTYDSLRIVAAGAGREVSMESLKVTISTIRKFLRGEWKIVSDRISTYRLTTGSQALLD